MPHHPWWHGGEARHGRARRKLLTINGIKNWSLGTGQPEILSGGHHLDGFDPDAAFVALDNSLAQGQADAVIGDAEQPLARVIGSVSRLDMHARRHTRGAELDPCLSVFIHGPFYGLYTTPPFITNFTLRRAAMSLVGSPSTAIRSANMPGFTWPSSRWSTRPAMEVADFRASTGVMP